MKNLLRGALVLVVVALTGGCMDISEEVWINADGSGRIKVDLGLSEGIVAMVGKEGDDIGFCSEPDDGGEVDPNIVSRDSREYSDAGVRHCVVDVRVKDFRKITEATALPMERGDDKYDSLFVIEDLGGGVVRFHQRMAPKKEAEAPNEGAPDGDGASARMKAEMEEMANKMMAMALADKYLSITLHAPAIRSNKGGELDAEKRTVHWKMPLHEFVVNHRALNAEAEVKYSSSAWEKVKSYFQ